MNETGQRPPGTDAPPAWRKWVLFFAIAVALAWLLRPAPPEPSATRIDYSTFYDLVEEGAVASVTIDGERITGELREPRAVDGEQVESFETVRAPNDDGLLAQLREQDVGVKVTPEEESSWLGQLVIGLLPWVVLIGVWIWLSRRASNMMTGKGGPMGRFFQSKPRKYGVDREVGVTFEDVAGLDEAKRDLREIIDYLREPEPFRRLGAEVPRGVLLAGPPGTGKTLLARAVAGEAGVPFYSMSAAEFIELFVGVGARRVRELFEDAKNHAPAIIFIDEIDAIGRARGAGLGGGHDEREQTLNQLLAEMDGFARRDRTIVLAATNRPDVLDNALLRPGRFDRQIVVDLPARAARLAILVVHSRGKPLADEVDLERIAASTAGFSGADLENLVNEAALASLRRDGDALEQRDFSEAYDKVVLGNPRETVLSEGDKKRVAVHESGHAVCAHFTPHTEPLERVSIIPRGHALGATQQVPSEDRHLMSQPELESRLVVLMGGYAAERMLLGSVSTGARDDLKKASELATKMVAQYGMSEALGAAFYDHQSEHPFLGQKIATESGTSDATVHAIETEARRLLSGALDRAASLLDGERAALTRLIDELLAREGVEGDELRDLLGPAELDDDRAPMPPLHSTH